MASEAPTRHSEHAMKGGSWGVNVQRNVTCYISAGRLPSGHRLGSGGVVSRDKRVS